MSVRKPKLPVVVAVHALLAIGTMAVLYPVMLVVKKAFEPGRQFALSPSPIPKRVTLDHFRALLSARGSHGELAFLHLGSTLELRVDSRYGLPSDTVNPAFTALIVGYAPAQVIWPKQPSCSLWTTTDHALLLAGTNDASGAWSGTFPGMPVMGAGTTFYAQVASLQPTTGATAFGDGSRLVVPPAGTPGLAAIRVAAGSDRTATTGTLATQVAVVKVF